MLQKCIPNEGDTPPQLRVISDTYITDTNKTMKKDKGSKLTKNQQAKVYNFMGNHYKSFKDMSSGGGTLKAAR